MGVDRWLEILNKPKEYQNEVNGPFNAVRGAYDFVSEFYPEKKQNFYNAISPIFNLQDKINSRLNPITSKTNDIAQKVNDIRTGGFVLKPLLNPLRNFLTGLGLEEHVTPDYAKGGKITLGSLLSILKAAQDGDSRKDPTFTLINNIPEQEPFVYRGNPTFQIYGGK